MNDQILKLVKELADVWHIEGSHPEYHRAEKERLKKQWPKLYNSVSKIANIFPKI